MIECNEKQCENPYSGINRSLESDSNPILAIELQFEKQDLQIISTERGMTIDFNDEQPSYADSSIRLNDDPDSNVKNSSDVQP
jgi:hypothetical protein